MTLEAVQVAVYKSLPRWLRVRAVRHATPNFTVGSLGLITHDGGHVLLVRTTYRNGWLPAGGFVRRGETPLAAVTREVGEELGVEVAFRDHHRVYFDVARRAVTFISVGVVPEDTVFVPRTAELAEVRWFRLDELPPMPHDFSEGMPEEDLDAIRAAVRPSRPRS
jgi:ADP-ribose pyrophosphatase YjhB (NUDIX family)